MRARRSNFEVKGFTLVEALVSLAIFAMAGLALTSAYVNVLSAQHAVMRRDATASTMQLIRDAMCAEPVRENLERSNDLKLPDDGRAQWKTTITPTTVADLFDVVLEAEITVDRQSEAVKVTENWRLLRPTWSQPVDRETLRAESRSKLADRTFK
jgi:general secretion pathway protein I